MTNRLKYVYIGYWFLSFIHIDMKKILICAICATILFGCTLPVHAKENSVKRTSFATIRTWGWQACDFNNNRKVSIDDITWYIDYCYLSNKWGKKCDVDRNWKVNIADHTYFNDICYKEVLNQPKGNSKVRTYKINQVSKNRRR